nr:hypothetical protein [Tanacetum cinerariifolium]
MHKAFPLPVLEFPLAEEVLTASEESAHYQKKRDATVEKIALLLKSSSNCQSKSYDSYAKLVPHVSPYILGVTAQQVIKLVKKGRTITLTADDMQKRKNDVKARTTLLLSLPDEHQLRFIKYKTTQELWAAILKTFDDDLYNHLKVYESEVQKESEPNSQNMAFISSAKHISGNEEVNTASVSTARVYKVDKAMGTIDQTLFIRWQRGDFILVQVYVDDIIFGSSNLQLCREFKALMHEKFQMSAMGELNFFLGLQVLQKEDGIFLSQDKYVGDILKKFGHSDVRLANTLMNKENPWGKDGTGKDVDLHHYRSMIGSLMYLTASKPDIMFAVCARARHQVTPKECHLHERIVATSTTEAEYVAAASCCGQVLWIQNQLLDYGLQFCDYHNMVAILEKSEQNVDFHPIADFVEASPLRYALTFKPTVYVSHIRQFWSTARIETTEEGTKILATIDGILRIVTESSLRRNLKLKHEEGISSLSDAELFENLTLKGYNISPNQKFTFQKVAILPLLLRARIAQSSALPPVADEPASPLRDVSQGEACPTVSSLDAEQDRANIAKTSTLPHESTSRRMEKEGVQTDLEMMPQSRGGGWMKGEAAKKGSNDKEEMINVLTSIDATTVLSSGVAEVPTGSGSIPTAKVPTGSDVVPTAGLIFATATVVTPCSRIKRKEKMIESKTPKKKKIQEQMDNYMARQLEEDMEREAQRMNEQIAKDAKIARIHAEEELRIELISDMVRYQDNYSKVHKYQTLQRKPRSKKQKKDYYMAVINGHAGWKTKDFKGMSFKQIEAKFNTVWKQIKDFILIGSKEETKKFKRKGLIIEQVSKKKLKTSEEVPEEVKATEEVPKDKVKEMMQLVPIEEMYVEALQVKHPIIDWKVHIKGQRNYWKIIRLGVKESLNIRPASSDKDMEIWVELKRLYEPDVKDQLWTHTQNMMHVLVEWKLYDSCGVHHVTSKDNEIFMLIEKDYPLRKGLEIMMISYKLQVENYSQMANPHHLASEPLGDHGHTYRKKAITKPTPPARDPRDVETIERLQKRIQELEIREDIYAHQFHSEFHGQDYNHTVTFLENVQTHTKVVHSVTFLEKVQTRRKVVHSGLLYQNNVKEVFSILNIVHPKFLKMETPKQIKRRMLSRSSIEKDLRKSSNNEFYEDGENTLAKDDNHKRKELLIKDLREMTNLKNKENKERLENNSEEGFFHTSWKQSQKRVERSVVRVQAIFRSKKQKKIIRSNTHYSVQANKHHKRVVSQKGDLVWIYLCKEKFLARRFEKLKLGVDSPFRVQKKINDNAYKIELLGHYNVSAAFNVSDLSPYSRESEDEENSRTSFSQAGEENDADL